MAITTADLMVYFSSVTYDEVRQDSLWRMLTTQDWTAEWVAGASTARIPLPTFTYKAGNTAATTSDPGSAVGVDVEDRSRGSRWANLSGVGSDRLVFGRSGSKSSSQFIGAEDILETPWNIVEEYRSRAAYEIRNEIDRAIYNLIRGYPNNTTALGDGSARLGINPDGSPMGNNKGEREASGRLVYEVVRQWSRLLEERDLMSEMSDSPGSAYCILHPRLFDVLTEDLLDRSLSWDALTDNLLRSNTVLASRGYKGRLKNVDIFSYTKAPIPTGSSKNTVWDITCGTMRAVAANVRSPETQYFTTEQNQITDEPGNVMRQYMEYGCLELDGAERMQKFTIDAHATD